MHRYQARYTEVLINLLENERTKPLVDAALSSYPLYQSTSDHKYIPNIIPTREEINEKILNYYKYREIGFETVGRFLDELEISMKEIMPYYNQLMFTMDQDYNVIYNVDYVRTIERNRDETRENETNTSAVTDAESQSSTETDATDSTTTNSTVQAYNKHVASKTPQDSLSITNQNIDNVSYADEVTWNHDTNTDNATNSGTSSSTADSSSTGSTSTTGDATSNDVIDESENTTETTKGNYGVVSAQDLVKKYREIILNIVQDIINDPRITELFMTVY